MLSLKPFNYIKRPINQFLFICFLLITACNDNTELYLDNYLTTLKIDYSQFEAVIIIPNGGCSSCIGSAFNFLKENHSEDNLLFIIANVLDPRAIRLRLKDITNNENVILDASPNFIQSKLNRMYPYICYMSDTSKDIRMISPDKLEEWKILSSTLLSQE